MGKALDERDNRGARVPQRDPARRAGVGGPFGMGVAVAAPRPAAPTDTAPPPGATGLRLELLGGLRLSRGGAPLAGFAYAKGRALLAYLALTGRPHPREALAALLWGDLPDAAARQN